MEARAGNLHIVQLWSDDQQRFLREWAQPTPPRLTTTSRATRNTPIYQFIIFDSCQADDAGNCSLSAVLTMTDPDGLPYGETFRFPVWDNQPAPAPKLLTLSPAGIGITVEDDEKLGTYTVRLAVTDDHAQVTATTEIEIVAEAAKIQPPADQ